MQQQQAAGPSDSGVSKPSQSGEIDQEVEAGIKIYFKELFLQLLFRVLFLCSVHLLLVITITNKNFKTNKFSDCDNKSINILQSKKVISLILSPL